MASEKTKEATGKLTESAEVQHQIKLAESRQRRVRHHARNADAPKQGDQRRNINDRKDLKGIPDPSGGDKAMSSMGDALLKQCLVIKSLLIEADQRDVLARYEIAIHCQQVREGDGHGGKYGAKAVRKLTQALNWSKSAVYDYANVALTWPDQDKFDELVVKDDKFGKPLSWSHIILLATVSDDARREQLIQDSLQNGWTVRELKMETRIGTTTRCETADAAEQEPMPPQHIAAAVQSYGAQVATFKRNATTFGQLLIRKMEDVDPTDLSDKLLDQMRQARRDVKVVLTELNEIIRQFREHRVSPSTVPNEVDSASDVLT